LILVSLAAAAIALGLRVLAARHPASVERFYAGGVHPVLVGLVSRISASAGFALAEAAVLGLALGSVVASGVLALRVIRRRVSVRAAVLRLLSVPLLLAGPAYLLFLLGFGLSYQRPSLAHDIGWDLDPPSRDELVGALEDLTAELIGLRRGLPEDRAGVIDLDPARIVARAPLGLALAARKHPELVRAPNAARPKCVALSRALTLVGLAGIYSPFTVEPLVNCEAPAAYLPFTATHELIHAVGVAREQDANFLAYVACREHPQAEFGYSGRLAAAQHLRAALARVDPRAAQRLLAALDGGPRRDLDAMWAFWRWHSGPLRDLGERVNDTYLKGQGIPEGVASYGRMVELIVAERRQRAARPGEDR
jgi:hypothetical protein